jgi:hypothetical protein
MSTYIGIEFRERKYSFIKGDITRYVDVSGSRFKTLEPFVKDAIPQEDTSLRAKLEFVGIIWTKIG